MNKKAINDEISLIDIFKIVYNEKIKIFAFVFLSLIVAFIFVSSNLEKKISINVSTPLNPISTLENSRYEFYNSVINNISQQQVFQELMDIEDTLNYDQMINRKLNQSIFQELKLPNIDRNYLFDLFIDKFNDKSNLFDIVSSSDYFDKKKFSNLNEYENEIKSFLNSLELEKTKNLYLIKSTIYDKEKYRSLLIFLEKNINEQIQQSLFEIFKLHLSNSTMLINYKIQDIKDVLSLTKNETIKLNLENKIISLLGNRYVKRFQEVIEKSPISKPGEFHAAKINFNQSKYQSQKTTSPFKIFIIFGIFGIVLGIFYVLILNAIKK